MNQMKKTLAGLLCMALLVTLWPAAGLEVSAAEVAAPAPVSGETAGTPARQTSETPATAYPAGYAIHDLKVENGVATVAYAAPEDATVIVALYAEDSDKLLLSGSAPALAEETQVQVTLPGSLPTYFQAAAYLVRTVDLVPMCAPMRTSLYTKDMQKLLKSTVKSYPEARVISLDGNESTNFAVLRDGTVKTQSTDTDNIMISMDPENYRYVLENPDRTLRKLQPGDDFVHRCADGQWIFARVVRITQEGNTLTVQGEKPDMTQMFSHVKIENTATMEHVRFDPATMSDNVEYLGPVEVDPQRNGVNGVEIDEEGYIGLKFKLELEADAKAGDVEFGEKFQVYAYAGARVDQVYYQAENNSISAMRIDCKLSLEGQLDCSIKPQALSLGEWSWELSPGVELGFYPKLDMELNGSAGLNFLMHYTTNAYSDKNAECHRTDAPTAEVSYGVSVYGDLSIGFDYNPALKVLNIETLDIALLEAGITAKNTLTFIGEPKGTLYGDVAEAPDAPGDELPLELHGCTKCVDGKVYTFSTSGFSMKYCGVDLFESIIANVADAKKLADFYQCECEGSVHKNGFTICPARQFLITVEALDEWGDPIVGMDIYASGMDEPMGTTNSDGVVTNYLPAGTYTFYTEEESFRTTDEVEITCPGKVRIDGRGLFFMEADPGSLLTLIQKKLLGKGEVVAEGLCGPDASYLLYDGGYLTIMGTGAVTEKRWTAHGVDIQVVEIRDGITDIADGIFESQQKLVSLTLPATLKTVGKNAFAGTKLSAVILPEGVTAIGNGAFRNCKKLATVSLPDSLAALGEQVFANCSLLEAVIIPRGVTGIPASAFSGCSRLKAVSLPNTVTEIGANAFYRCEMLSKTSIPHSVTVIGAGAYESSGITFASLSSAITSLGARVFAGCKDLRTVDFPDNLQAIPGSFLSNCSSLAFMIIPDTVTAIGAYAFSGCESLTKVVIPNPNATLGSYAFQNCTGLTTVKLPEALKLVDYRTFQGCTKLVNITIPSTVTEIRDSAFANCKSLERIALPYGITKVADGLFNGCVKLADVTIPETVTEIGNSAFAGCGFSEFAVPSRISRLGYSAFFGCANLKSIRLPESIPDIPVGCFQDCAALTSVSLPDNLKSIEENAFLRCASLASIAIPEGVTAIGSHAFDGCAGLTQIRMPQEMKTLGEAAFQNCSSLQTVRIPAGITKLQRYTFYGAGLESVEIPEGVTAIGDNVFAGCEALKSVTLPSTLQRLGYESFKNCLSLTSIRVPQGVTELPHGCFYGCKSLVEAELTEGMEEIRAYAFYNCRALECVEIPETMQTFGISCFAGCKNLLEIYFPYGTQSIATGAFTDCDSLTSVVIPATVTTMGLLAFAECEGMDEAWFEGDAPSATSYGWFVGNEMTVYYPEGNGTWSEDLMKKESGILNKIKWVAYTPTGSGSSAASHRQPAEPEAAPDPVEAEAAPNAAAEKTVTFEDLIPGQSYLLLVVADATAGDLLAHENLLYVNQLTADPAGTVTHTYIPRADTGISFVLLCGDTKPDLKDATATFPAMTAGATEKAVNPLVTHNGNVLEEGVDYRLEGDVSYTKAGTYTCTIRGIHRYTGTLQCTYTVGEAEYTVTWISASTTLGGNIGLNFYVELSDSLVNDESTFMRFTFAGNTIDVPLADAVLSNGQYKFTCPVNAKNMTDVVTAQVMTSGGNVGEAKSLAVVTYCNFMIQYGNDPELVRLMKAMLNYGAAAQVLFNHNTENLANAGLSEEDRQLADVDASGYAASVSGSEEGIALASASLMLETETSIRIYFKLTGSKTVDAFTFLVDGKEVKPVQKGSEYYVEIANIAAQDLDAMHTVTVGGLTVRYGGLSYVNTVLNNQAIAGEALVNTAKALFAYNKLAESYFN